MIEAFIAWLRAALGQIYVWGGNGQEMTPAKIKSMETSDVNYERALALYNRRKAEGKNPILGYDCSGLISRFLQNNGIVEKKRNCNHLAAMCQKIYALGADSDMQLGDLVFRHSSDYYHVGAYIGNGRVIESFGRDLGVVERDINASGKAYWTHWGRLKVMVTAAPEPAPIPAKGPMYGTCTGGSVNFRTGRGTQHAILGVVRKDDKLLVMPLADGWHEAAAVIGGKLTVGYISAKYVRTQYE